MSNQPAPTKVSDALVQRYQALLDVSDVIQACRDLDELFKQLAGLLRGIVAFDSIAIALVEPDKQNVRIAVIETWVPRAVDVGFTISLDGIPAKLVIEEQRSMRVRTADNDPRFVLHNEKMREAGFAVSFHFPLTTSLSRLGEMIFACREMMDVPESEMQFMQRVADQVAVAIENAANFDQARHAQAELEHRNRQRELLLTLTNSIVSRLDFQEVLDAVVQGVREVVPCAIAVVALPDENEQSLTLRAVDFPEGRGFLKKGVTVPLHGSMAGQVYLSRTPVVLNELNCANYTPEMYERVASEGLKGQCFMPLLSRGRALGVLAVARREQRDFTIDEVTFLQHVAGQVAIAVENAIAYREITSLKDRLAQEKLYLEDEIRAEISFDEIIGESTGLKTVLRQVQTVANSDSTVLILGETGTGKELVARAIHEASKRRGRTFVKLNCAAIPTGLLESELFGHERGAFTGAIAQKIGRMELANGGTLFLDEVGDIPLELQPKLLRALQEREYERLGSVRTQKSDVRFLAATNRDLQKAVADKEFRSDLFYRLNVFPLRVPPLRDRREDIPRLVRYFVSKYAKKMDKRIETVPAAAMSKLQGWHWPGNVRELENFVERSVILTSGAALQVPTAELQSAEILELPGASLRDSERDHILQVLRETRGVLAGSAGAAARLGVKRTTLQSKMKKLGITRESL